MAALCHTGNYPGMRLRVKELRIENNLTLEQLAERAGISVGYLSRIENERRPINSKWIASLSEALNVEPSKLFSSESPKRAIRLQSLVVVGQVQAGSWVEAMEWPIEDQYSITVPPPPKAKRPFGLMVNGQSMNKVFKEGAIAVCVHVIDFWRELETLDYVVCQRTRSDGLIEATVKQLMIDTDGRAWLWPRSEDPHHQQPIEVPWPADSEPVAEAIEVAITAVVVGVYQTTL